jgi:hypothetical protein
MSSTPGKPAGGPDARQGASDAFRDFIEERYHEWENEFGDDVHVRRTTSFEAKQ